MSWAKRLIVSWPQGKVQIKGVNPTPFVKTFKLIKVLLSKLFKLDKIVNGKEAKGLCSHESMVSLKHF